MKYFIMFIFSINFYFRLVILPMHCRCCFGVPMFDPVYRSRTCHIQPKSRGRGYWRESFNLRHGVVFILLSSHFFFSLRNFQIIFRSTGRRPASYCHGVVTSCVRPSVRSSVRSSVRASVNFFFKKLLLRNYWLDFNQISQECSLGGPLSNFLQIIVFHE